LNTRFLYLIEGDAGLILLSRFTSPPPWFQGWIVVMVSLIFALPFLYYGFKHNKQGHEESLENLPKLLAIAPWWVTKLFLLILGGFILIVGMGYLYNVIIL
jgi:hypothetical protein